MTTAERREIARLAWCAWDVLTYHFNDHCGNVALQRLYAKEISDAIAETVKEDGIGYPELSWGKTESMKLSMAEKRELCAKFKYIGKLDEVTVLFSKGAVSEVQSIRT